jgi:hypothetical protein
MLSLAVRQGYGDRIDFTLHVRNSNRHGTPPLVRLKALCGPGDQGEPVVTVMLPEDPRRRSGGGDAVVVVRIRGARGVVFGARLFVLARPTYPKGGTA